MERILVLVDFSDASANAVLFAAELSKRSGANLLITNVLKNAADEDETVNTMNFIAADLKKTYGSDFKYEILATHGSFISAVKKIIEEQAPDLVVMGTKGASGLKELLIGSNTVNVISKTDVPVLVIPEAARFEDFSRKGKSRIVLATDLELENFDALKILKEIALFIIEPRIRVLSVRPAYTNLSDEKREKRDNVMAFFNPEIETNRVTVFSDNVIGGINFYLNEKTDDTGLIAMVANDSGGLIQKHYTREMASHTHLPLLVLHDVKS